jgi:hypothetical protein
MNTPSQIKTSYAVQELRPFINDQDIANCATAHGVTTIRVRQILCSDSWCLLASRIARYLRTEVICREQRSLVHEMHNANFE